MRPETAEWVAKAEADFASMRRETSVDQSPNYDLICFLAQQCVEKYLKALLCEEGIAFPKTHDLNKAGRPSSDFLFVPARLRSHAGSSGSLLR